MTTSYKEVLRSLVQSLADQAAKEPDQLDQFKKLIEIVASCLTLIAIIVGAIWTYWLFVRTRQKYPSVTLTQRIDYRVIASDKVWLRVTITLQNTSKVLLSLVNARSWVQQVIPVDEETLTKILKGEEPLDEEGLEYLWPLAVDQKEKEWSKGSREIEPGESDQVHFDFLLGRDVETIIVYSYFRNAKKFGRKKELGWQITNVYDLKPLTNEGEPNEVAGTDATKPSSTMDRLVQDYKTDATETSAAETASAAETGTTETAASGQEVETRTGAQQAPVVRGGNDESVTTEDTAQGHATEKEGSRSAEENTTAAQEEMTE
jgi:hypothetical protein